MSINDIQNEIIDEFAMFDDWMQRYEYMIELGKSLPLIDEQYKTDDHLIKGCQSKVWLHAEVNDGKVNFTADKTHKTHISSDCQHTQKFCKSDPQGLIK